MDARARAERDASLVARLRAGDQDAFAPLYDAYARAVHAAVSDRVRDPDTRNDLVQETFVRALTRLEQLRDAGAFRPWLLSIARNTAVDHVRRHQRIDPTGDESVLEQQDTDASLDDLAQFAELAGHIHAGLARLSRRDATALTLTLRLGLSTEELAAALGVTPGAAKVALHRARQRLQQALRLQVLLRGQRGACATLRALYDDGSLAAAVRHTEHCTDGCGSLDEVEGFAAQR